jgi:hypothetical protein
MDDEILADLGASTDKIVAKGAIAFFAIALLLTAARNTGLHRPRRWNGGTTCWGGRAATVDGGCGVAWLLPAHVCLIYSGRISFLQLSLEKLASGTKLALT